MKTRRVTTWKERPAIMMLSPVLVDSLLCEEMEAKAPPAAWRTREMTSQGMNWWVLAGDGSGEDWKGGAYKAGVGLGLYAGVFRPKGVNDAAEAEVDTSC
jgi:hypothetical protein